MVLVRNVPVGYTLQHIFCQPLVMAVPFGLIMGDLSTALIIGAGIEMMYVGLVTNGGNIPADECLAGVVAIPIALASGMDCTVCYCPGVAVWFVRGFNGSD